MRTWKDLSWGGALALGLALALPATAGAQIAINPQAGVNLSRLSDDPGDFEQSARVGYQFGGFLRMGQKTYLQPGIFWLRSGTELEVVDDLTDETVKDATDMQGLYIPVALGTDLVEGDSFRLRANLGASATLVTSVSDNDFGIEKDDFEDLIWGARAGLGLDLTRITIDVAYDYGLTKVFKDDPDEVKNQVVSLTVGLLLY